MSDFDKTPIPATPNPYATPLFESEYMEAKVLQDFRLINSIVTNYNEGWISESAALAMLDIVRNGETTLADNYDEVAALHCFEGGFPFVENAPFVGGTIAPYREIVASQKNQSFLKPYTLDRTWGSGSVVESMATTIADELEDSYQEFIESKGKRGFDPFIRNLYSKYPTTVPKVFLFETVLEKDVLTGSLMLEDAIIANSLAHNLFTLEEMGSASVGSMMPVVPVDGTLLSKQENPDVQDMVDAVDTANKYGEKDLAPDSDPSAPKDPLDADFGSLEAVMNLIGDEARSAGLFIATEAVVYRNNPTFDSEARKLYAKIKPYLKLANPNDDTASMASMLNVKKNRYSFTFAQTDVSPDQIRNAIIGCGFKPIKENGIVIKYSKPGKKINIELEFTGVDSGIQMYYTGTDAPVKEAAEESALEEKLAKYAQHSDTGVREAARKALKTYRKHQASEDKVTQDDVDQAVNAFEHILDNWKDVQKEKEVKECGPDEILSYLNEKESTLKAGNGIQHFVATLERAKDSESSLQKKETLMQELCATTKEIGPIRAMAEAGTEALPNIVSHILHYTPFKEAVDATLDLVKAVYNTSHAHPHASIEETTRSFAESVANMWEEMYACEAVLNRAEYQEQLYLENDGNPNIDDTIEPIVNLLNRLGYTVKYSSAGHNRERISEDRFRDGVYHGKIYTTARITFDKKYNFKSAPEGWYFNPNADKTSMYVKAMTYDKKDGTPDEAFQKWKRSYVAALKTWAENLEDSKETDSDAKTESTIAKFEEEYLSIIPPDPDPLAKFNSTLEAFESEAFNNL